jgi:hypothetical protein
MAGSFWHEQHPAGYQVIRRTTTTTSSPTARSSAASTRTPRPARRWSCGGLVDHRDCAGVTCDTRHRRDPRRGEGISRQLEEGQNRWLIGRASSARASRMERPPNEAAFRTIISSYSGSTHPLMKPPVTATNSLSARANQLLRHPCPINNINGSLRTRGGSQIQHAASHRIQLGIRDRAVIFERAVIEVRDPHRGGHGGARLHHCSAGRAGPRRARHRHAAAHPRRPRRDRGCHAADHRRWATVVARENGQFQMTERSDDEPADDTRSFRTLVEANVRGWNAYWT